MDYDVPYEQFPRCVASNGLDLLATYCVECVQTQTAAGKCEVLRAFAQDCIAQCDADIKYGPIFEVRIFANDNDVHRFYSLDLLSPFR